MALLRIWVENGELKSTTDKYLINDDTNLNAVYEENRLILNKINSSNINNGKGYISFTTNSLFTKITADDNERLKRVAMKVGIEGINTQFIANYSTIIYFLNLSDLYFSFQNYQENSSRLANINISIGGSKNPYYFTTYSTDYTEIEYELLVDTEQTKDYTNTFILNLKINNITVKEEENLIARKVIF